MFDSVGFTYVVGCSEKLLRFEKVPRTYLGVFYLNRSETPIVFGETSQNQKNGVWWCPEFGNADITKKSFYVL